MKIMKIIPVFLFSITISLCAQVEIEKAEILEYGIYEAVPQKKLDAEDTADGSWTIIDKIQLVTKTDTIPAKVNTQFGFWFKLEGKSEDESVNITFVNKLPGLKNPKKEAKIYEEQYPGKVKFGQPTYKGYAFEADWECVPGDWVFQIFHNDEKLIEKKFTVIK